MAGITDFVRNSKRKSASDLPPAPKVELVGWEGKTSGATAKASYVRAPTLPWSAAHRWPAQ